MLRSDKLFKTLTEKISRQCSNNKLIKANVAELQEKFDIPAGLLTDYATLRVPVDDASEFILYALCTCYLDTDQIKEYFTDKEIKFYSKTKFEKTQLSFPLELPMIQIASDQWIGSISVKQLMQFRDSQIINYNERTQRTMERKIAHGREYYQISINELAVKAIERSYETDTYIPNTLTFNISDDSEADYSYDSETRTLIIKKIKHFDIVDGYHRYRAIAKIFNKNPKFDYQMELRIVNFSETKAKQFIWQEDQKTKMSKITSNSYNQTDFSVYISERLASAFPGVISRNAGMVTFVHLVDAIKHFYDTDKIKNVAEANLISNEIKEKLEALMLENPHVLDKQWRKSRTYSTICIFKYKDKDFDKSIEALDKLSRKKENAEYLWTIFFNKRKASALVKLMKDNNI